MSERIYIAGCGGMLGAAFHQVFGAAHELRCTDIAVNESWLSYLDFRNFDAYRADVRSFRPDRLFHLGAHTDLEFCEHHVDDAYATNALAVENATRIANELDIPLLYISTAGIFDGRQDLYDDWDTPNPLGVYARSKYAGERHVVEHARRWVICRAGWMMGGGPRKDKKFIQKMMAQLKAGRRELFVVNDRNGTPTYTVDFARNTEALLASGFDGLYNMVCGGLTSRLEVASEMLGILGLRDQVRLTEVDSGHFRQEYFAARPASERLLNRKLDLRGLNQMRDWRIALREYLEASYGGYLDQAGIGMSVRD
jgi:dTDP-4-dehydrorhamnose reductase